MFVQVFAEGFHFKFFVLQLGLAGVYLIDPGLKQFLLGLKVFLLADHLHLHLLPHTPISPQTFPDLNLNNNHVPCHPPHNLPKLLAHHQSKVNN